MENIEFNELLKQIIDQNRVYLLQATDGLFAMVESADGLSYLPVWADVQMAKAAINEEWAQYQLSEMDMPELITWLNELVEDEMKIGLVINEKQRLFAVDALEFQKFLLKQRKNT